MDNEMQVYENHQEDKFPRLSKKSYDVIMKRWIQQPSFIFLCAMLTLCIFLLFINIIIVVLSKKDLKEISASLEKIMSGDKDLKQSSESLEQIMSGTTRRDKDLKEISASLEQKLTRRDKEMKEISASLEQILSATTTRDKDMKEISASLEQIMSATTTRDKDLKEISASLEQIMSGTTTRDKDLKEISTSLEQIVSGTTARDKDLKEISASLEQIMSATTTRDKDMKEISASLEQIMSGTTTRGSDKSDIQRILSAVERLSDTIGKRNNSQESLCSTDWTKYGQSCYYFSKDKKTWSDAKKYCEDQESHLVVITSKEEQDEMNKLSQPYSGSPWIGLTDVDGEWKWVDGTPYDSTPKFWGVDQPDDWYGHGLGGGEDCAHIYLADYWNDDHCLKTHELICEKSSL